MHLHGLIMGATPKGLIIQAMKMIEFFTIALPTLVISQNHRAH